MLFSFMHPLALGSGSSLPQNMFQGFRWLTMDMKPGDSLVFHFSGEPLFLSVFLSFSGEPLFLSVVLSFSGEAHSHVTARLAGVLFSSHVDAITALVSHQACRPLSHPTLPHPTSCAASPAQATAASAATIQGRRQTA